MAILRNLREVFKGLKHKKTGVRVHKLCPKCGDPRINLSSGFEIYSRLYGIVPEQYFCEICGYKGPIVMELEETS